MTSALTESPGSPTLPNRGRVLAHGFIALGVIVLAVPALVRDPYIRFDDYPVLVGDAALYFRQTLTEGRWLNWLWALRPWPFDPVIVTFLHLGGWALTAALVGNMVFGTDRRPLRAMALTIAIAVSPTMAPLSAWPATTFPATAVLAAYAWLAARRPGRPAVTAFWVFVPLGLMSYPTHPFAMALIAAASFGAGAVRRDALRLAVVFALAFGIGILAIFSINWFVHGTFGVEVAPWRSPNPGVDLDSITRNFATAVDAYASDLGRLGLTSAAWQWFMAFVFVAGMVWYALRAGAPALILATAILLVLAVNTAITLRTGAAGAFRANLFEYLALLLVLALAARTTAGGASLVWMAVLVVLALPPVLRWSLLYVPLDLAQVESRQIVRDLVAAGVGRARAVHIVGDSQATPRGAVRFGPIKLGYRINTLTRRPVRLCLAAEDPACAAAFAAARNAPVWPAKGAIQPLRDGAILLHLPRLKKGAVVFRGPIWKHVWTADGRAP